MSGAVGRTGLAVDVFIIIRLCCLVLCVLCAQEHIHNTHNARPNNMPAVATCAPTTTRPAGARARWCRARSAVVSALAL